MNKNDIKKLLRKGERQTLEVKLAKAEVPKSIWESYSVFANTGGGMIQNRASARAGRLWH